MYNIELPIFHESDSIAKHVEFLIQNYDKVKTKDDNNSRIVAIFPGELMTDPLYCIEIANSFLNNAKILLELKENNEYKTTW